MPFLGFPSSLENIFFVASGLAIACMVYFSHDLYCSYCKRVIENNPSTDPVEDTYKNQNLLQKEERDFTSSDAKQA